MVWVLEQRFARPVAVQPGLSDGAHDRDRQRRPARGGAGGHRRRSGRRRTRARRTRSPRASSAAGGGDVLSHVRRPVAGERSVARPDPPREHPQDLPPGRGRRAGAARRVADDRARRDGRADGRLRLGQDHADEHPRLPRPADLRPLLARRRGGLDAVRRRRARGSATARSASSSRASTCCRAPARSRT